MTYVYITIDVEYESGFTEQWGRNTRAANFARSIACETGEKSVGVEWQMDRFDEHGLKGVFFVDSMPALLWGTEAITDIVQPIVERGHDVQLHVHTEWLELAGANVLTGSRTGRNIKDFSFEDQCRILDYARSVLMAAGAPRPIAFRAGNYGANDNTLRALAELGFTHETSHCPGIADSACEIALGSEDRLPLRRHGVIEVPIGCIDVTGSGLRHAQLTALSSRELHAAIHHAKVHDLEAFTLVSHSFEMLSRDRTKINWIVKNRFKRLLAYIAGKRGVTTGTYAENPPRRAKPEAEAPLLPADPIREGLRMAEQVVSNALFGGD